MEGGRLVTIQSSQILINIKGVGATLLMLFVTRGSEPLEELRPLRLCGSGGRKEREGSERVGHTDSRGEILSQTNDKSGPIGLAKQWMGGGSFVLSKSESLLFIFCFVNCFNTS